MKKYQSHREAGFWDRERNLTNISKLGDPLERLSKGINFEEFRPLLESKLYTAPAKGKGGRPPYDVVLMFKILILQRHQHLSDDQTEFQINDRNSFQRFLDIRSADRVPDSKTIWLFRETLTREKVLDAAFALFLSKLESLGLIEHEGTIIDGSFTPAPRQRNTHEENDSIKMGITPSSFKDNKHKLSQKDVDARWTKKNNEKYFGYKDHVKIDSKSKIITGFAVTDASVHDSQALATLLADGKDDGTKIYGDSAYGGQKQEETIELHKMEAHICEKGTKGHPLTDEQRENNRVKSKTRCRVEHIFGFMENSMHGMDIACIGMTRAAGVIALMNLTYNMCRMIQLTAPLQG